MSYQLEIEHCQAFEAEQLSELLEALEALSISLSDKNDDPILEPELGTTPLWPEVVVRAIFPDSISAELAQKSLFPHFNHLSFAIEKIEEQEWERAWMKDFKPQQFGKRLWICPSHIEPPQPEALNLILDPGLAFGTGTHPTTALCLNWLDGADLANKSLIDYGCGSGILALAALKLGAEQVYAVDIDKQALEATHSNAVNNFSSLSNLTIDFPEKLENKVDIIIANILLGPLTQLKERFSSLLNPKGYLIVSGILTEQASSLIQAYQSSFEHQLSSDKEDWALLVFQRI